MEANMSLWLLRAFAWDGIPAACVGMMYSMFVEATAKCNGDDDGDSAAYAWAALATIGTTGWMFPA